MKIIRFLILCAALTSSVVSHIYATKKSKKDSNSEKIYALEGKIALEINKLHNMIETKFPFDETEMIIIAQPSERTLLPLMAIVGKKTLPKDEQIEIGIKKTIENLAKAIENNKKKELVWEKYQLTCSENEIKKNLHKKHFINPIDFTLLKHLNEKNRRISTLLQGFSEKSKKHDFRFSRSNSPHNTALDTILNILSPLSSLFKNKPRKTYQLLITPTKESKKQYKEIINRLVKSLNFNTQQTTSFSLFNSQIHQDEEANAIHQDFCLSLHKSEELINEIFKKTPKIEANLEEVTKKILKRAYKAHQNREALPEKIKKIAKKFEETIKSQEYKNTKVLLEKAKRLDELRLLERTEELAKIYIDFSNNKQAMMIATERTLNKHLVPLFTKLMSNSKITNKTPVEDPQNSFIQRTLLGIQFILDRCNKIDIAFSASFAKIQKLFKEKNLLLQKLASSEPKQTNVQDLESNKEETKPQENEKEYNSLEQDEPFLAPNDPAAIHINKFTKKLRKQRLLARYLINPQSNNFDNELSDKEAALFHNLPETLCNHPEIVNIRTLVEQKQKKLKTTKCVFQKIGPALFFWIPAIINYQDVNNVTKTETGAIEIFFDTATSNFFHIWFKNTDVLNTHPNMPSYIIRKIENKLKSFKEEQAQSWANQPNINELIPNKEGWALDLSFEQQKNLLLNFNKEQRYINWIYYA